MLIRALFPCGDRLVCVIDDREDVWNFASNVVQVKPYRYFKNTGDINAPTGFMKTERNTDKHYQFAHPKKSPNLPLEKKFKRRKVVVEETDEEVVIADVDVVDEETETITVEEEKSNDLDDDDDYLYYLEEILSRIYTAFYQLYDQMPDSDRPPDLHSVIPYVKLKVLKNVNLVFSAVIPTNVRPENSSVYNLAKNFGAVIQENVVTTTQKSSDKDHTVVCTTHVVAGKWGTNKVKEARAVGNNIKIVTPQWLWCCAERWERVEEDLFPLSKDTDYTKLFPSSEEGGAPKESQTENNSEEGAVKDISADNFEETEETNTEEEKQLEEELLRSMAT